MTGAPPAVLHRRLLAATLATIGCFVAVAYLSPVSASPPPVSQVDPETPPPDDPASDPFDNTILSPSRPTPVITPSPPAEVINVNGFTVRALVSRAKAVGEIIWLERLDGETWTVLSSTRVKPDGSAALVVTRSPGEPPPTTAPYRIGLASTTKHKEATSEVFMIQVPPDTAPEASTPPEPDTPALDECGGQAATRDDGHPWVCTYSDDFDGTTLDRRYWLPQVSAQSGFYTGTDTKPACFLDDPQTIAVHDGNLDLNAKVLDAPVTCADKSTDLVSGMVSQLQTYSQAYGKFEVRAKVPDYPEKGLQETFWLWPNDQLKYGYYHPSSGEIDFAEFYSNYSYLTIPVMHYLFDPNTVSYLTNTNIFTGYSCAINVGEYNTYGVEWAPGQLKILVNGQVCINNNYIATNAPEGSPYAPFDQPFFLALTQAFGTTDNAFDPATGPHLSTTSVDYVRIWR